MHLYVPFICSILFQIAEEIRSREYYPEYYWTCSYFIVHLTPFHTTTVPVYCSYFFTSSPSGGVHSVFFFPISDQLVDRTVPLLSTNDFIIARRVSSSPFEAQSHNVIDDQRKVDKCTVVFPKGKLADIYMFLITQWTHMYVVHVHTMFTPGKIFS